MSDTHIRKVFICVKLTVEEFLSFVSTFSNCHVFEVESIVQFFILEFLLSFKNDFMGKVGYGRFVAGKVFKANDDYSDIV